MKKAYITVGLGFGDEGKGATVDYLCRRLNAELVVRYSGGSQCGHNVQLPGGKRHTFSQFGSGTLSGVPTYLGQQVIINPPAMREEAKHLHDEFGINDPFSQLKIHSDCLVSTIYHQRLNQIKELSRGCQKHGSCGHGIGETRDYWLKHGDDSILAIDLKFRDTLCDKLELLRQRTLLQLAPYFDKLTRSDRQKHAGIIDLSINEVAGRLLDVGSKLQLQRETPDFSVAVFEGAQGVLLDEWYGFHPYTTWSTVTPHHAHEMLDACDCHDRSVLGITRAYATRHGAGPLPTFDEGLTRKLVDPGNPRNQWQEGFRCGWLDLPLLRYAVKACGKVDGIVLNHLDQTHGLAICDSYQFFENYEEELINAFPNYSLSTRLSAALMDDVNILTWHADADGIREVVEMLAPIVIEGHGPTYENRSQSLTKLFVL